jgi:SIR2-like domain
MTHILLTGAGFSRNWGGMLAPEVFQYLLGCNELDEELRRLLLRDRSFEDVLAALQRATDAESKRRYDQLTSALVGMFNGMGLAFMQREFEFRNPPDTRYSLTNFLMRFDAIFTVNQDTLLEQKYIPFVGPPKWGRAHLPGVKYLGNPELTGSVHDRIAIMEPNPSDFRLSPGVQPYIKLHGSTNWNDGSGGGRILIMGGQKAVSINQFPILSWYHRELRNMLIRPGARLMVIGYSFSDAHINDAVMDAIKHNDLKVFLIDPSGDKIFDKRDPRAMIPDHPGPLLETIPLRLIGISQRPIASTFNDDTVEHEKLTRFFG